MNSEININEIMKIEQMPVVFEQLERIGTLIDEKTKDLDKLECNEENKQEVKRRRAEINKTLEILETRRKEIKVKLLEPYNIFEDKYNNECKEKLQQANEMLKTKIETIEKLQKDERELELKEFAQNWFVAKGIEDYVSFEDIKLNITLSASMKSLEDKIIEFCEKVFNDLKLIEQEEYKEEILLEYKHSLDFTYSKLKVLDRYAGLEALKQKQETLKQQEEKQQEMIEKVEEVITPPKEVIEDTEIIEVQFKVITTKEKILKLRDYLKENEINYE